MNLDTLKALASRVMNDRRFCCDEHHRFLAEGVLALFAENETLRKDAERYRWLRDPDGQEDLGSEYNMPPIICGYAEHEDILAMTALDRAIDTGMEETK